MNKRKWLRAAAVAAAGAGLIALFWLARPVTAPFLLGAAFAYLAAPQIDRAQAKGVPVGLTFIVIVCWVLAVCYFLLALTVPLIIEQLRNLFAYLPEFFAKAQSWLDGFFSSFPANRLTERMGAGLPGLSEALEQKIAAGGEALAAWVMTLPSALINLVLAPVLAYYFLLERKKIKAALLSFVSPGQEEELTRLAGELNALVRSFVNGYFFISLIVGAMSAVLYYALGIDYPLVLGVLMGVADLIPYFGPFIGALPAVLLALSVSRGTAVAAVIGILVIQQLESSVITPRIMGDRIGLSPLVTIFAVLAGGYLRGIIGALIALPLAAVVLLIGRYVFSRVFANNQLRNLY
ncbi:MAG: AI-2E family transporter [Firmicutes bacterium]|nr:AI-2E family transporter [Bacillota bacterium]